MVPTSPYDRINEYVNLYNKALYAQNIPDAIRYGSLAVRDAADELKKPNLQEPYKIRYQEILRAIKPFLDNPEQIKQAAQNSIGTNDSEDKIKTTDWFGAPIPKLKMKDIAGLGDVKEAFVVNVLAPYNPLYSDIYRKYRGDENGLQVLLYGPPGTGKTHIVKCLAGEMNCKIAVVQIKDVMANLVGDGAKIIAEIFEQARQYDRCIIFFDEIDAIASSREGDDSRHTKEQLTTLLTNMDGFTSKAKPGQLRVVIAATNRPWALDSAVKRGGRFDTQIYVTLPDTRAREWLISKALGMDNKNKEENEGENVVKVPCAPDVTLEWLVEKTKGYAGADINAICRQAVVKPMTREILARSRKQIPVDPYVTKGDFENVLNAYINPTNTESLLQFDAYSMNMEYDEEYKKHKLEMLLTAYYKLYKSLGITQGTEKKRPESIVDFEYDFFKKSFSDVWFKASLQERFKGEPDFIGFLERQLG